MRTYEKQWFKLGVITYVVTLFLLVILPGILVGIWTLGEKPSGSIEADKVSVMVWAL